MQAIVIWANKNTTIPSVLGPYEDDSEEGLIWDDAKILTEQFYKVQVCQINSPGRLPSFRLGQPVDRQGTASTERR